MRQRRTVTFLAIAAAALAAAAPASAVDDVKPAPCGLVLTDPEGDNTDQVMQKPVNMDIVGFFLKHDPTKGAEATTANIIIKDLSTTKPAGASSVVWSMQWVGSDKVLRFVRAVSDYTNTLVFEHGEVVVTPGAGTQRFEYRGATPGKLFEGPMGVVQIVIPPAPDGAAGKVLSDIAALAQEGRQVVPNAIASPTRGLSSQVDRVPDGTEVAGPHTIAPCAGLSAPVPAAPLAPAVTTASKAPATTIALVSTKLAAAKVKKAKKATLALRSSGVLKNVTATLKSGAKVVGSGKLASLNGNGKLTLKLKKAGLKKGAYKLSLTGIDTAGKKRSATAKLTVA